LTGRADVALDGLADLDVGVTTPMNSDARRP
jgi:hypothetical protein